MKKIFAMIGVSAISIVITDAAVVLEEEGPSTLWGVPNNPVSSSDVAAWNFKIAVDNRAGDRELDFAETEISNTGEDGLSIADSPGWTEVASAEADVGAGVFRDTCGFCDRWCAGAAYTTGRFPNRMNSWCFAPVEGNALSPAREGFLFPFSLNGAATPDHIATGTAVAFRLAVGEVTSTPSFRYFNVLMGATQDAFSNNRGTADVQKTGTWVVVGLGTSFMLWNLRRKRRFEIRLLDRREVLSKPVRSPQGACLLSD